MIHLCVFIACSLLSSFALCAENCHRVTPVKSTHRWQKITPQELKIDAKTLAHVVSEAEKMHFVRGLMIAQDGKLVVEKYWRGQNAQGENNIKSVTKSVVSALVGIALEQGKIKSIDRPISDFFPDYFSRPGLDQTKRKITVKHLLTMTSGLESTSKEKYGAWVSSKNWVEYVLSRPLKSTPGEKFDYSTGNAHLLSAILTKASGLSTLEFAQRHLLAAAGVQVSFWCQDPQEIYLGGNNLHMRLRDMALFGQLYLNEGYLNGQKILSKKWVNESLTPRVPDPQNPGLWYGYQWWSRNVSGKMVYFAWGYGGQYVFLIPDKGILMAMVTRSWEKRTQEENMKMRELAYGLARSSSQRRWAFNLNNARPSDERR